MQILHANWYDGSLRLWAESLERFLSRSSIESPDHPFAAPCDELSDALASIGLLSEEAIAGREVLSIRIPSDGSRPQPSDRLASTLGTIEDNGGVSLLDVRIPCLRLDSARAAAALLRMEDAPPNDRVRFGASLRYWTVVARFVLELLADQRFVPALVQERDHTLRGRWQPWLHDSGIRARVGALLSAMPPSARAPMDHNHDRAWPILSEALSTLSDAMVREILIEQDFPDAIAERDPQTDPHVAWLTGLLDRSDEVVPPPGADVDILRDVSRWLGLLDETGRDQPMKLCFRLNEPSETALGLDADDATTDDLVWRLSFHLQPVAHSGGLIDAETLWSQPLVGQGTGPGGEQPQELLLRELARANRMYAVIERALAEPTPSGIDLTTSEAYEFLSDHKPVLEESGFRVIVPRWWNEPSSRLGARLQIESPEEREMNGGGGSLGLNALVQYNWQVAVGDQPLSMEVFQRLARQASPLVRVRGRWIEIRPDDMARAVDFLKARPGGQMTLLEAIRVAYGTDDEHRGLPVTGLDASGWVAAMLGGTGDDQRVAMLDQPTSFRGELRPYQKTGLSWLAFLDRLGLGACLADDMGLGKTIQMIALLLHERASDAGSASLRSSDPASARSPDRASIGPTLLIVPTSVVANWNRELGRFAPELTVLIHHGPDRSLDPVDFSRLARESDVVITTYALITRDRELLTSIAWHRVALDEAQYIKNPPTKQTAAIRALETPRRIALTGTPVENRLTELWSIMDFCNPGYLGSFADFRRRFAVPVERHRDQRRADMLRRIVRPFILRRLKTDPKVITDLPSLVETKEYATLTAEQAALYERTVNELLGTVDRAEGIERRGLVLATLVKLKQICNHPAQIEGARDRGIEASRRRGGDGSPTHSIPRSLDAVIPSSISTLSRRSGKAQRLLQLLEEVVAGGDRALVFTQFRRMGHLLGAMIRDDLDCDSLFLHGGTPAPKRQEMIDRFQSRNGSPPVFILSLKAGGLGLNLTAANHVFHFDRWWNPAVENQATDRAFRIGQTRNVHVHKFVCVGTLEERIDQMIEQKMDLAENIVGAGEQWLTELSTGQLREMLTLRRSAIEVES